MDVRLPNGFVITNVPDDITQDELARIAVKNNLASVDDFGDLLADQRTFGGQTKELLKAIPRGFANALLTSGEGLAELSDAATNVVGLEEAIDSGDENELVKASREGRAFINENLGADIPYRDTWTTKFGEGIGSFG